MISDLEIEQQTRTHVARHSTEMAIEFVGKRSCRERARDACRMCQKTIEQSKHCASTLKKTDQLLRKENNIV